MNALKEYISLLIEKMLSHTINKDGGRRMKILKKNEKANPCYGIETQYITDKMIEALKEGNRLYTYIQDGEYALIIKYKKGRQKNEEFD